MRVLKEGVFMSLEVNNNGVFKTGTIPDSESSEKFKFKQVQVGSIFLKDDGDGKISLSDFNRTTGKLADFIMQYADGAADWTKDTYSAIVGYLNKNKDEIKNDSINEVISSFQAKAADESQIVSTETDGDWTVTRFKDSTFMKENKSENKIRFYDEQGRWIAGIMNTGTQYLNTYLENSDESLYAYVSEEIGNNNLYYYGKNDKLIMIDDGKNKFIYIDGPEGKLQQVEKRDSKTGRLILIGYADENEKIIKIKEFKKDPVSNKPYIEETDCITNRTMKIFDAVVQAEIFEIKDTNTGEVTYRKVVDHNNNTITITENGITTITDLKTGEVKVTQK